MTRFADCKLIPIFPAFVDIRNNLHDLDTLKLFIFSRRFDAETVPSIR
jgi:hypothetical protein